MIFEQENVVEISFALLLFFQFFPKLNVKKNSVIKITDSLTNSKDIDYIGD